MGIQIEDGKGKGYSWSISSDNRGQVNANIDNRIYYFSRDLGNAYSWSNISYDYDAGDTILLVRNDDTDYGLVITKIYINGSTATEVVIHSPTTTFTPTGTAVTGINLNRTSGKLALATAKADETGNTQGYVIWRGYITANAQPLELDLYDAIILGYANSIGVDFVTDGTAARVTIIGFFDKIV